MSEQIHNNTIIDAPDIVKMSGVRFTWPGRRIFEISIREFNLASGSKTLLVGPSGSGKSTLLSLICGIAVPQEGQITILGTDIAKLSNAARDRFRAEHIGVIFQMFNLLPYGSVVDNIVLPLSFSRERRNRVSKMGGATDEAGRILDELGIDQSLLGGSAAALSVGQQQRVAAARAIIGTPELIVADEPTSALDLDHQQRFLDLLFRQMTAARTTLLMVSHDRRIGSLFDQVIELENIVSVRGSA
ncbi:MAG: ATP-binding cassette domain-containing protein [Hyphomicrobiaceae bacterium]